jgi:hypothetical protein
MDSGVESGFGIISSLQGVGAGSSRSLSPWMVTPVLAMLYCRKSVNYTFIDRGEAGKTHEAIGEDPKLGLSFQVLGFKYSYEINSV